MKTGALLQRLYDAINFIVGIGIPKPVIMDAATAAAKVINEHLEQNKSEKKEKHGQA